MIHKQMGSNSKKKYKMQTIKGNEELGQCVWCQLAFQNFILLQLATFQSLMHWHSKTHIHIPWLSIAMRFKYTFMCIFKSKNTLIPCHCTTSNIKKIIDNKYLILNVTSQNNAIKATIVRYAKNVHELWRLTLINERVLP